MKTWEKSLRAGAVSGSVSSVLSTVMLAACGQLEAGSPAAPTNAISHWIWGDRAARRDDASARHTLPGYLIHHGACTLWATVYEKWFGDQAERNQVMPAAAGAAAVAALACFVDYNLTPRRLRPGYEKRLSKTSLLFVYAITGAGFMVRGLIESKNCTKGIAKGE